MKLRQPALHHQFRLRSRETYSGTEVWTDAAGGLKDAEAVAESTHRLRGDSTGGDVVYTSWLGPTGALHHPTTPALHLPLAAELECGVVVFMSTASSGADGSAPPEGPSIRDNAVRSDRGDAKSFRADLR